MKKLLVIFIQSILIKPFLKAADFFYHFQFSWIWIEFDKLKTYV